MSLIRKEVLRAYKNLQRTCQSVFNNDTKTIAAARARVNKEYRTYKGENCRQIIQQRLKLSRQVVDELRTTVVQAIMVRPGVYQAQIREDTIKSDNIPYNPKATAGPNPVIKRKGSKAKSILRF